MFYVIAPAPSLFPNLSSWTIISSQTSAWTYFKSNISNPPRVFPGAYSIGKLICLLLNLEAGWRITSTPLPPHCYPPSSSSFSAPVGYWSFVSRLLTPSLVLYTRSLATSHATVFNFLSYTTTLLSTTIHPYNHNHYHYNEPKVRSLQAVGGGENGQWSQNQFDGWLQGDGDRDERQARRWVAMPLVALDDG